MPTLTTRDGVHVLHLGQDDNRFSLDLEWVMANLDELRAYTARVEALLGRVLTLPVPTVAAVSGHAFGAGAMLATAHDWRVMRADRGYFRFPEVDINIPFTPGMSARPRPRAARTHRAQMTRSRKASR